MPPEEPINKNLPNELREAAIADQSTLRPLTRRRHFRMRQHAAESAAAPIPLPFQTGRFMSLPKKDFCPLVPLLHYYR